MKPANIEKTQNKKKQNRGFVTYIFRVLKQVHPAMRIKKTAGDQLNEFLIVLAKRITNVSKDNALNNKVVTISPRHVQHATRMIFPGELAKHAVSEGTKAVTKYNTAIITSEKEKNPTGKRVFGAAKGGKNPHETKTHKAGLTFSVARCEKYLRESQIRVGAAAPVYLAAALEYLCAEILELAGNAARDGKAVTVNTRHIFLAISNDGELTELMNTLHAEFMGSGVQAYISEKLKNADKPSKKAKKSVKSSEDSGIKKPHKFRPGTVALREIRKQQKSTLLILQKAPVERNIRSIMTEFGDGVRFSDGVIFVIQSFLESKMIKIFAEAQKLAIYAGRESISGKDIEYASKFVIPLFIQTERVFSLHENSQIPEASLRRLARRGGVKRILKCVYAQQNAVAAQIIGTLNSKLYLETQQSRKHTVSKKILRASLEFLGYNFIF